MNSKKFFIVLFVLIVSVTLTSVSATDINDETVGISQQDVLKASSDFSTFNTTIQNAEENSVVNLDDNVLFSSDNQSLFSSGIAISKNLTINGNGYTINATGDNGTHVRLFNIDNNSTLTLKNIKLVGGYFSGNGGLINVGSYSNLILNNVTVSENNATGSGGAIYLNNYANLTATDVTFNDNNAGSSGGAIYANQYTNLKLTNVTFDTYYSVNGGAIYLNSYSNLEVKNSKFMNYYIKRNNANGGAIFVNTRSNLTVSDSLFKNNTIVMNSAASRWSTASNKGGAIYCGDYTVLNVTKTVFDSNNNIEPKSYATAYGGAISSTGSNSQTFLTNCTFVNNSAGGMSVIHTRIATITGCVFINNSHSNDYPEIYYEGSGKGTISYNAFLDNVTSIRIMNSGVNVVENNNWWGSNNPGTFLRIQNDYKTPNNYVVMDVYNKGNTVYAALIKDCNGDFLVNPELLPIREAVFKATVTTTVNTSNAVASTTLDDEKVNVTIDNETIEYTIAPGNVTSIKIESVENASAGANATITFALTGDSEAVDGKLSVYVNDKVYAADVVNGSAVASVGSDFIAGVYDIYYNYEGSSNYAATNNKTKSDEKVEIYKNNVTVTYTRDKNIITFNVSGANGVIPTGNITASLGNVSKNLTLSNGIASYNYGNDLNPDNYTLTVDYFGDNYNNLGNLSTTFEIIKYGVEITFTNVTNILTFNVTGVNDVVPTGTVTATLGNSTQNLTLSNGIASYDFGKVLDVGKYNLTVDYSGDDYYISGNMSDSFEIVKITPSVNMTLSSFNMTKWDNIQFVVTVTGDDNIATGSVTVTVGTYTSTRNLNQGKVSFYWGNPFEAGYYNVSVTYNGDGYYYTNSTTLNETLAVKPYIDITVPEEVYANNVPVQVSINPNKVNGTLIVKMDGIEVYNKEITSGSVYIPVYNVESGEHTFNVTFKGNELYPDSEASTSADITFPELPQWGQNGYDYTNSGQSPYMRGNNVVELWNYTGDGNLFRNTPLIDKDGNIVLTFGNKFITLSNNGTFIYSRSMNVPGYVLDSRGLLICPFPGNNLGFATATGEEFYIDMYGELIPFSDISGSINMYFDSSRFAGVIGPDGSLYIDTQYAYGEGYSWNGNCWISHITWTESWMGFEFYTDTEMMLPIDGISYGSDPHLASVTLDNLGNLWHTSTSGLRGIVISSNTIGFQNPDIGTKGRAVVDANNIVYAFGNDDKIYALTMNGVLWNTTVTDGSGSNIVVGKDSEYVLSINSEGVLYKYDATDGSESKIFEFNTTVSSALMTDANGIIYVGDDDGNFWALKDNGEVLWKFEAESAIVGLPSMDKNGVIYIYTADNVIHALGFNKLSTPIAIDVNDTTTVDGLKVIVNVNETATGEIIFILNDENNYTAEIINGTAVLSLDEISVGEYNIMAVYDGNYEFEGNSTNSSFTVSKADTVIDAIFNDTQLVLKFSNGTTGYVLADIDDIGYYAIIEDDEVIFNLINLKAGEYTANIKYLGDDNYNGCETEVSFNITEKDPNLKVEVVNNTINVSLNEDATGFILVDVADIGYYAKISNGKATVNVVGLEAGNYTATVTYTGNEKYEEKSTEANITIAETEPVVPDTTPMDVKVNNNTLDITLPENATGYVLVDVESIHLYAQIKDGKAVISVPGLKSGVTYNAVVTYSGDENFAETNKTVVIAISKDTELITPDMNVNITDEVVNVELPGDATGFVLVNVEDTGYYAPLSNGKASIKLQDLTAGNHTVDVTYTGDKTYNQVNTSESILVEKALGTIISEDLVKIEKNASRFEADFTDMKGYALVNKSVTFTINGNTYTRTTDNNGRAGMNINLVAGTYSIIINNTETGEVKINNIIIQSKITENPDLVKYYRNASRFSVRVLDDNGNPVGAGETVQFNINGLLYDRTTDESGYASIAINLQAGTYIVTSQYKNCKVSNEIKVLSVLSASDLTKKYGVRQAFTANLLDGTGKALANTNVTFNINGMLYTRTTNANGTASLNINLQAGEYIITTSYNGCNIANKVTITP